MIFRDESLTLKVRAANIVVILNELLKFIIIYVMFIN